MIQVIAGDKEVLNYKWQKRPSMLRYKAKFVAPTFYSAEGFTTTDYTHGTTVLYQKERDRGCFEVVRAAGMSEVVGLPVYKKFYLDYTPWLAIDDGEFDVTAMYLDESYQTLFVLLRQQRTKVHRVGLWLARIDIAQDKFELPTDLTGIPLCEFLNPPAYKDVMITNLSDRLNWICSKNWEQIEIAGSRSANSLYNLIITHGKVFVTVPLISNHSLKVPDSIAWDGEMVPALIQALFMFDLRTGILEGSGIIGVVSAYSEEFYSPSPNNWPVRPAKIGATYIDDCIVWSLSTMHTLPKDLYEEHLVYSTGSASNNKATRQFLPTLINRPDGWAPIKLPDGYRQLFRREAVNVDGLIEEVKNKAKGNPLKPVMYDVRNQFYIQHPPAFDLADETSVERSGQGLLVKWSRGLVYYGIRYHNFHRKVIKQFTDGSPAEYEVMDHEVGEFVYTGAGELLSTDGVTKYYHIFGLENLSSNTYMVNVKLTAPAGSTLRFGRMTGTPSKPNLTSITWDEIAPHTEALFTAYASEGVVNRIDTCLEYGLEIR